MSHIKFRINDYEADKSRLNRALELIDELESRIHEQDERIGLLRKETLRIQERREVVSTNNLTFNWTGATTTVDWAAGYVRDKDTRVYPIPAGSRAGLTASTNYWAGWNPTHLTMSFEQNLDTLTAIPNILIIGRIATGGGGVNGVSGGGGTESGGVDRSGEKYVFV